MESTELARLVRAMTRQQVVTKAMQAKISWRQAAVLLGLSERQVRRIHRKLGKRTGRRRDGQYEQGCNGGGYCEPPPSTRSERASHGQLIGISTHKVKTFHEPLLRQG